MKTWKPREISNFRKSLEKPHFVSWCCNTPPSKGFYRLFNLRIEKKTRSSVFSPSNTLTFEVQFISFGWNGFNCHMEQKWPNCLSNDADLVGWKRWNAFFSNFKLNNIKKAVKQAVLEHQGTKCDFYELFWKTENYRILRKNEL